MESSAGDVCIIVALIVVTCMVPGLLSSESWNYEEGSPIGPENWHWNYSMCGGISQSPIDVTITQHRISLSGLNVQDYYTTPASKFTLTNDGHSAKVTVNANTIKISGAELESTYILEQFHFHWGSANNVGSEHTVGGKAYPLEIHFVHYKDIYKSVSEAAANVNDTTGLAVLGVFVDISSEVSKQSKGIDDIANQLSNVATEGAVTPLDQFALSTMMPCRQSFYRYNGSLTTPGCAEVVVWTVFTQPIYINQQTLDKFRHIYGADHTYITKNFRPSQQLGSRTVYHYEDTTICLVGEGIRLNGSVLAVVLMAVFVALLRR